MRIFLICGKAGVGKNEVANIINEYYNTKHQSTVITGFSKYIKIFAKEVLNWDGNEDSKPRDFLQNLGQNARKLIDENIFVDRMLEDLQIYQTLVDNVIISDVRLKNEIFWIKHNYKNVYVIRVNKDIDNLKSYQKKHNTEIALDKYKKFDYIIDNNQTTKELKEKVLDILKEVDKNES